MPQRTNNFQQLVECIHRLFDDKNATFNSSAMISSKKGREKREVDLLIQYIDAHGKSMRIAVEAKDFSKKLDITGIERYIGKYASPGCLPVNKVIIVAHGFTKSAIERAKDVGFCLKTINEIENLASADCLFDNDDKQSGYWCISKEMSNKAKVELWDSNNRKIPHDLSTILISNSRKVSYSAYIFAVMLLQNRIGKIADKTYKDYAGSVISIIIEYDLKGYTARYNKKNNQLGTLKFYFTERLIFPAMTSKIQKDEEIDGDTKVIVEEIGHNDDNILRIVHESNQKLYVQHIKYNGKLAEKKIITIKINSNI